MNWKKSATTVLIGLLVLSGCTDAPNAPSAELSAQLPDVNPGATDFLECFEAEGGGDLTFKDIDTDGFFLFSFPAIVQIVRKLSELKHFISPFDAPETTKNLLLEVFQSFNKHICMFSLQAGDDDDLFCFECSNSTKLAHWHSAS